MGIIAKRAELLARYLSDNFLDQVKSEGAEIMADQGRQLAPVSDKQTNRKYHPGNLKRNIRTFKVQGLSPVFAGPIARKVPYAHFVHAGTKNQIGQPYLYRAFVMKRNQIARLMVGKIQKKVDEFKQSVS